MFVAFLGPPARAQVALLSCSEIVVVSIYSTEIAEWRKPQTRTELASSGSTRIECPELKVEVRQSMISFRIRAGGLMNNAGVIVASLERAPALVVPLVREVPQAILKRRPLPVKLSAHEHACHLATIHPVMFARLDLMLTDARPRIVPYFPSAERRGSTAKGGLGPGDGTLFKRSPAARRTVALIVREGLAAHGRARGIYALLRIHHVSPPCDARYVPCLSHRRTAT